MLTASGTLPRTPRRNALWLSLLVVAAFALAAFAVMAPDRSGDAADPGVVLPDGRSFAFLTGLDAEGLDVDQASLLTGAEAVAAAIEDGALAEGEDLPYGFYIRNESDASAGVKIAADATYTVLMFDGAGSLAETEIDHAELLALYEDESASQKVYGFIPEAFPVELTVADGVITGFEQVYLP